MRKQAIRVSAVLILLLAFYLRARDLGNAPLGTDGAVISLRAIDVARHGQLPLLGPVMSVGFWHSPLSFYLYAIPYALSFDPRIASLFTTAINLIAIALLGRIGLSFFSRPAALIALLLYAVMSSFVGLGRDIWNPLLGAPFVMLYILAGLEGHLRGRAWGRIVHLPALCLAIQCHPGAALLLPVTAPLLLTDLASGQARRVTILWQTALGALLAAALAGPWMVGLLLGARAGGAQAQAAPLSNRGWFYTFQTLYEGLGYWQAHWTQPIAPALVLLGSLWLLARAPRWRSALPGLAVTLGFWLVPLLALAANAKYRPYYMDSSLPLACLILGALLGGLPAGAGGPAWLRPLLDWRGLLHTPVLRWAVPILAAGLTGLNLIYDFTPPESIAGPQDTLTRQINAIRLGADLAATSNRDLLLLAEDTGGEPPYRWLLLASGQPAQVVWRGRPLPLDGTGAVLVGYAKDNSRPGLFEGGRLTDPFFRVTELPAPDRLPLDWPAPAPIRFSNGTTVLGFFSQPAGGMPLANSTWTLGLLARVDGSNPADQTFFIHLINSAGDKLAQVDVPSQPAADQRPGESLLTTLKFQIGPGLPASGPLYLRIGLYDSSGQAKVLDTAGNPAGDYGLVQVRGADRPAVAGGGGVALDSVGITTPLIQGPPLTVQAAWHFASPAPAGLNLRWRLRRQDGSLASEGRTDLAPGLDPTAIPAGAFLSQTYALRVPPDLAPQAYMLELSAVDGRGADLLTYRAPVEIQARPRQFSAPATDHSVQAVYGGLIKLLGYDLSMTGRQLSLKLYWQARAVVDHDYKYFVHVWRDGQLMAQVDSAPGQYGYPTSWWAPDEVIAEPVSLDLTSLAPGSYTLTTGFYNTADGGRLPVVLADGSQPVDNWVTLQTLDLP